MYHHQQHHHGSGRAAGPSSSASSSSSRLGDSHSIAGPDAWSDQQARRQHHHRYPDDDTHHQQRGPFVMPRPQMQQSLPPPPILSSQNPYFQSLPPPPSPHHRPNGPPSMLSQQQRVVSDPYRRSLGPSHRSSSSGSNYPLAMDQLPPAPPLQASQRGRDLERSTSSSRSSSIEFMGYAPNAAASGGPGQASAGSAPVLHPKLPLHLNPAPPALPQLPRLSQRGLSPPRLPQSYSAGPEPSSSRTAMKPPLYHSPPQQHPQGVPYRTSQVAYGAPPPGALSSLRRPPVMDDGPYVVHDSSSSAHYSGDFSGEEDSAVGRGARGGGAWQSRAPPPQSRSRAPLAGSSTDTGDESDLPDGRGLIEDFIKRRQRRDAEKNEGEMLAGRQREERERSKADANERSRRMQMDIEAEQMRREESARRSRVADLYGSGTAPGRSAASPYGSYNRSPPRSASASHFVAPPAPPEALDFADRRPNPFASSLPPPASSLSKKRSFEALTNGSTPAPKRAKEHDSQALCGFDQQQQLPAPPPPYDRSPLWGTSHQQQRPQAQSSYGRNAWDDRSSMGARQAAPTYESNAPRHMVTSSSAMFYGSNDGAARGGYGAVERQVAARSDPNPFRRSFDGGISSSASSARADTDPGRPRWTHDVLDGAQDRHGGARDATRHEGRPYGNVQRQGYEAQDSWPRSTLPPPPPPASHLQQRGMAPIKRQSDSDDDEVSITRVVSQNPLPTPPTRNGSTTRWQPGAGGTSGAWPNGSAVGLHRASREEEIKGDRGDEPSSTQSSPGVGAAIPSYKAPLRPLSPLNWLKGIQTPEEGVQSAGGGTATGRASPNGALGHAATGVSNALAPGVKKEEALPAASNKASPVKAAVKRRGRPPGSKNRLTATTAKARNATASPAPGLRPAAPVAAPALPRGRPSRPQRAAAPQSFKDMYDRPFDSPKPIHAALPLPLSSRLSRLSKNRPVQPAFRLEGPAAKLPEGAVPLYRCLTGGVRVDDPYPVHLLRTPPLAARPLGLRPAVAMGVDVGQSQSQSQSQNQSQSQDQDAPTAPAAAVVVVGAEADEGSDEAALAEEKREEEEWERGREERIRQRFEAVWM